MRFMVSALVGLLISASFAFGGGATSQPARAADKGKAAAKAEQKVRASDCAGRFVGVKLIGAAQDPETFVVRLRVAFANKSIKAVAGYRGTLFVVDKGGNRIFNAGAVDVDGLKMRVGDVEVREFEMKPVKVVADEVDVARHKADFLRMAGVELELTEVSFTDDTTRELK